MKIELTPYDMAKWLEPKFDLKEGELVIVTIYAQVVMPNIVWKGRGKRRRLVEEGTRVEERAISAYKVVAEKIYNSCSSPSLR